MTPPRIGVFATENAKHKYPSMKYFILNLPSLCLYTLNILSYLKYVMQILRLLYLL